MIKIGEVYRVVRDLANKDQKGFVTPAVFNTLAPVAQQNVYNGLFDKLTKAKAIRRSGNDPGMEHSPMEHYVEDLSMYIQEATLREVFDEELDVDFDQNEPVEVTADLGEYNPISIPNFVNKIISISNENGDSVEIIRNPSHLNRILKSNLSAPTDDFPVAFIQNGRVRVYPDTTAADEYPVLFYRSPRSVKSNGDLDTDNLPVYVVYNQSGNVELQNENASRNFDLPENCKKDIVVEMSKLIGIRLRDNFMAGAMNAEESKQQ